MNTRAGMKPCGSNTRSLCYALLISQEKLDEYAPRDVSIHIYIEPQKDAHLYPPVFLSIQRSPELCGLSALLLAVPEWSGWWPGTVKELGQEGLLWLLQSVCRSRGRFEKPQPRGVGGTPCWSTHSGACWNKAWRKATPLPLRPQQHVHLVKEWKQIMGKKDSLDMTAMGLLEYLFV